jgi:hypothetical protein
MATLNSNNTNTNTNNQVSMDGIAKPPTLLHQVSTPTSNSPLSMLRPSVQPQLNSITLSKALTKPPPLSSVLQLPKNALLNSSLQQNGTAKSASSSLSPSPLPVNPSMGSNLIAQTKASAEISANNAAINTNSFSPSSSISSSSSLLFQNQLNTANNNTFSNSLPAATTAQLFPQNKQVPLAQHGLSSLAATSTLPQSSPQLTSLPIQQQQFSSNPSTAATTSLPQSMGRSNNNNNNQSIFNQSVSNASNQLFNSNSQLSQK